MYRILVIEDDANIAQQICEHLSGWGHDCRMVENLNDILTEVIDSKPDLILLDIMLPFRNGFYYCAEIRKFSTTPIIFISSASDNLNIMTAMDLGGDDFIAKPFDLNILSSKVNSLIRRTYSYKSSDNILSHRDVILNLSRGKAFYQESEITLSKTELAILQLLMENKGRYVSRDRLMDHLWSTDSFIDDNTLSVNIARIRKKFKDIGLEDFIGTKKGLGYCLC